MITADDTIQFLLYRILFSKIIFIEEYWTYQMDSRPPLLKGTPVIGNTTVGC